MVYGSNDHSSMGLCSPTYNVWGHHIVPTNGVQRKTSCYETGRIAIRDLASVAPYLESWEQPEVATSGNLLHSYVEWPSRNS